jgi:hypothetical protein
MDFATLTLGDLLQAGAWVFMAVLFVKGDVLSKPVVDKMLEHGRDQAKLVAKAVTKEMKEAVKQGILEANHEMNGAKKKKKD